MAGALRGQRQLWGLAAAVIMVVAYLVVAPSESAATVPAPHSCFDAVETVSGNIGTNGDDVMIGTSGPDVMHGRGGNDLICGGGGGDTLYGEGGGDRLKGEAGPDKLYGGIGNDHLVPNDGDLVVDGQDGRDCTPSGLGTSIEYACPNQPPATTTSSTTSSTTTSTTTTTAAPTASLDCTTPAESNAADDANSHNYDFGFVSYSPPEFPRIFVTCTATGTSGAVVTFGSRTFTSPGGMGLSGFADCGATLAVGSSCVVGEVQFGPTGSGSYSGQFDISHDGINASPQVLTFVGQGFCGSC